MSKRNACGSIASALAAILLLATCSSASFHARVLGGTVDGLEGTGLVLQFNGGDDLTVDAGATSFRFRSYAIEGQPYRVTVLTQPSNPTQTCTVSKGEGTTPGKDISDVAVSCSTIAYSIGGVVSGLGLGSELVLQLNAKEKYTVNADGVFSFTGSVESGAGYSVTIATQPISPLPTCSLAGGAGVVGSEKVTSVVVTCSKDAYGVGGSVTGLAGSGLILQLNGQNDLDVSASNFSFLTRLASGSSYVVTVATQPTNPWQTCSVANGSGVGGSTNVANVAVTCSTNTYSVSGTVTGLRGTGLVLQQNELYDLAIGQDGNFSFTEKIASGTNYSVTVKMRPTNPWQECSVAGGAGIIAGADVGNVVVNCPLPGTVSTFAGLAGHRGSTDGFGTAARFDDPFAVAVDNSGNLYVADSGNSAIRKIALDSTVTTLGGTFSRPHGVAVDRGGNVYVAEYASSTVRKIKSDGSLSTLAGTFSFSYPIGIAVDKSGNVYVADDGNNAIRKILVDGSVITLAGTFNRPYGVAVDDGSFSVYVAETGNNAIQKIKPDGTVTMIGTFNKPFGVAVDSSGNVYVANTANNTIERIKLNGTVTILAGTPGHRGSDDKVGVDARFDSPTGVAVDGYGNVYVADANNCTIRKITPDGL